VPAFSLGVIRSPHFPQAEDASKLKAKKGGAFSLLQVDDSVLLFVDLDLQFRQLFPQSLSHRRPSRSAARPRIPRSIGVLSGSGPPLRLNASPTAPQAFAPAGTRKNKTQHKEPNSKAEKGDILKEL
jgi:hypothetical protein